MKPLHDNFPRELNVVRNMAEAERLHETLHYNKEMGMEFDTFFTQCHNIYNIYENENLHMTDVINIWWVCICY